MASIEQRQTELEKLSHSELVSKCLHYLSIAQKAKVAKDVVVLELEKLKKDHEKYLSLSSNYDALQEIVSHLTDSKVDLTSKNERIQRQLNVLSSEVEELRKVEKDLIAEIRFLKTEKVGYNKKFNTYEEKIKKINEELIKSNQDKKLLSEQNFQCLERTEEMEHKLLQVSTLKEKYQKLSNENKFYKELMPTFEAQQNSMTDEIKSLKEEIKVYSLNEQESQNELLRLKNDFYVKCLLISELEAKLKENEDSENQNTKFKEKIQILQKLLNNCEEMKENLADAGDNKKKEILHKGFNVNDSEIYCSEIINECIEKSVCMYINKYKLPTEKGMEGVVNEETLIDQNNKVDLKLDKENFPESIIKKEVTSEMAVVDIALSSEVDDKLRKYVNEINALNESFKKLQETNEVLQGKVTLELQNHLLTKNELENLKIKNEEEVIVKNEENRILTDNINLLEQKYNAVLLENEKILEFINIDLCPIFGIHIERDSLTLTVFQDLLSQLQERNNDSIVSEIVDILKNFFISMHFPITDEFNKILESLICNFKSLLYSSTYVNKCNSDLRNLNMLKLRENIAFILNLTNCYIDHLSSEKDDLHKCLVEDKNAYALEISKLNQKLDLQSKKFISMKQEYFNNELEMKKKIEMITDEVNLSKKEKEQLNEKCSQLNLLINQDKDNIVEKDVEIKLIKKDLEDIAYDSEVKSSEIHKLQNLLLEVNDKNDNLQAKLYECNKKIDTLLIEIEKEKEVCANCKNEFSKLVDQHTADIFHFNEQSIEITANYDELKKNYAILKCVFFHNFLNIANDLEDEKIDKFKRLVDEEENSLIVSDDFIKLANEKFLNVKKLITELYEEINKADCEKKVLHKNNNDLVEQIQIQKQSEIFLNEESENLKRQHEELLTELGSMNNMIKERGEKIAKVECILSEKLEIIDLLQKKCDDFEARMEIHAAKIIVSADSVESVNEKEIQDLQKENKKLMERLQQLGLTGQSEEQNKSILQDFCNEALSTSTISKAEETQRMKELEDTFEERYMKLKTIAIKMKKNVSQLTADLKTSNDEKQKLLDDKNNLLKEFTNLKAATKSVQAMQYELDKIQDELDSKLKLLKEKDKELTDAVSQISSLNASICQKEKENEHLMQLVKNVEVRCQEKEATENFLLSRIAKLEKCLSSEGEIKKALQEQKKKAEERADLEAQKIDQLNKEMESFRQEFKKKTVIDLEIKDYEITVAELNSFIAEKEFTICEFEETVKQKTDKIALLEEQLIHRNIELKTEQENAETAKKSLQEQKSEVLHLKEEKDFYRKDIFKAKEKIELLSQCSQLEKEKDAYQNERDQLQIEIETLRHEYQGYKVRVHSVLKQKEQPSKVDVVQLYNEKEGLQTQIENLQKKFSQLQSEFNALQAEHGFSIAERERLSKRNQYLSKELVKCESLYKDQLTKLERKLEKVNSEFTVNSADFAKQKQTLAKSYENQISTLKQCHHLEVQALQEKLENSEEKIWQLKNQYIHTGVKISGSSDSWHAGITITPSHLSEADRKIDMTSVVREDGEGSEWVDSLPSASQDALYSPPPLEQLISSPRVSTQTDDTLSVESYNTELLRAKNVTKLEEKINLSEKRILQLTSLLHDSEAENAKLIQLTDTLKEEIRRSSRNKNLEKHLENMEYIKNIIIKESKNLAARVLDGVTICIFGLADSFSENMLKIIQPY